MASPGGGRTGSDDPEGGRGPEAQARPDPQPGPSAGPSGDVSPARETGAGGAPAGDRPPLVTGSEGQPVPRGAVDPELRRGGDGGAVGPGAGLAVDRGVGRGGGSGVGPGDRKGGSDGTREVEALIEQMARLPGLGPRSARRVVLQLLRRRGQSMLPLAQALERVARTARDCAVCGNVTTAEICGICAHPARATGEICVVADIADLWAMERGGAFGGRYHVLGGLLSALDAVGPDELRIPALVGRVAEEGIGEVILALDATVEGQTTAHYIAEALAGTGVRVSSLAQGVPIGGELDHLDDGTITAALRARRSL